MSKIKVSLIEDTSESDVEEKHESDEVVEPVLSDMQATPLQLNEKPKRIRKKPEPKPIPPPEAPPPPPAPEPEKQQAKGKMINCINCDKKMLEKTFKYYHQLKCKPKESVEQAKKIEAKPENFTVDFGFQRKTQQHAKYTALFSKAVKSN